MHHCRIGDVTGSADIQRGSRGSGSLMGGASPSDPRPPAHTKSSDPKLTTASPPSLPHRYNLSSRTETSFTQFLSLVYPFSELAICTPSSSSLSDSFLFPSLVLRSSAETTRSHSTSTSSERPFQRIRLSWLLLRQICLWLKGSRLSPRHCSTFFWFLHRALRD